MSELKTETGFESVKPDAVADAEVKPFRVFNSQKDFDDFSAHLMRKAEEKVMKKVKVEDGEGTMSKDEYDRMYRKDLEASIRAELKREAEMTEAEKLASEKKKMEDLFRQERIEINREKARVLLEKAGFEEQEMEVFLDFVTEDREISLGKIMRVCESRKADQERLLAKFQSELQASNPSVTIGKAKTITREEAQKMSIRERTELKRTDPDLYATLFK